MEKMKYRNEIDVLRAIAVLLVILFHLEIDFFSGGYIGVDVFFVISGYLISSVLVSELEQRDSIDFTNFFYNRLKRLAPAYIFCLSITLISTTVVSIIVNETTLVKSTFDTALSSMFYVSNFYFWLNSGYFSDTAESNPLLHTWSLSVEEQFYILWPVLIIFLYKSKIKSFLLFTLTTLSFAACFLFTSHIELLETILNNQFFRLLEDKYTSTSFFLTPFRTFEFIAGAIFPLYRIKNRLKSTYSSILSTSGLALIIFSGIYFDKTTFFPGFSTLLPTIGTFLIILTGEKCLFLKSLTKFKPLIFTGKISYSLYLFHWPIIVLYKKLNVRPLGFHDLFIISIITLALSLICYFFVENKFRFKKTNQITRQRKFIMKNILAQVSFAVVLIFFSSNSILSKLQVSLPYKHDFNKWMTTLNCHANSKNRTCLIKKVPNKKTVFLIGDSHAANLLPATKKITENKGLQFNYETSVSSKLKLLYKKKGWKKYSKYLAQYVQEGDTIIFSYAKRRFWKKKFYNAHSISSKEKAKFHKYLDNSKLRHFNENIISLFNYYKSKNIHFYFVKDLPTWLTMDELKSCIYKKVSLKNCSTPIANATAFDPLYYSKIASRIKKNFINIDSLICPNGHCNLFQNGKFNTWDTDPHLNYDFAKMLIPLLGKYIDEL